jgi:hypothetical protein
MKGGVEMVDEHASNDPVTAADLATLRGLPASRLWEMAGECDTEPADPNNCIACAAYIVAQELEEDA